MKKRLVIIISIIAAFVVVVGGIGIGVASSKVKLNNYVAKELPCYGANGYATIDTKNIVDIYGMYADMMGIEIEDADGFQQMIDSYDFENAFNINIQEKNENIKNGDTIHVTIKVNKERINSMVGLKKKLKGDAEITKTYKIKNLPEIKNFDPFDVVKAVVTDSSNNVSIVYVDDYKEDFNGTEITCNSYGGVHMKRSNDTSEKSAYSIKTNTYTAEAGSSITLTVSSEISDYRKYGLELSTWSKEYTVEKSTLIKNTSEIGEANLNKCKQIAADYINEHFENSNATLVGVYFNYNNNTTWKTENNSLVFLYEGLFSVSSGYYSSKTEHCVKVLSFDNLSNYSGGLTNYTIHDKDEYSGIDNFKSAYASKFSNSLQEVKIS